MLFLNFNKSSIRLDTYTMRKKIKKYGYSGPIVGK
jgi:hypothetical protein